MIRLERVSKRYGDQAAVDRVSLAVARGELVCLVGESGCGKTTTLKLVNRLLEPSAGRILLDGADTRGGPAWELRRRIGYVFQGIGLFPHLTVAANVGVTPRLLDWEPRRIERRVDELLELVGLEPARFRARMPAELSGGQGQRVGLARALAARPEVVLLDEPFGALDPLTRERLQGEFRRIQRELALTAVFVTHDMAEALLLADRVAVMEGGRLAQVAPPAELVRRPASPAVKRLVATPLRQARELERHRGAGRQ